MNVEGQPLSIVFWTSLLRKEWNEYSHTNFTDFFVRPTMSLLQKSEQPRVSEEMKIILQLS